MLSRLHVSTKSFALLGASLLLLDYASTSVVSAATAASYLAGEVNLPFPTFVGAIIMLSTFTLISLSGIRESARLALAVLSFHASIIRCRECISTKDVAAGDNGRVDNCIWYPLAKQWNGPTERKLECSTGAFCKCSHSTCLLRILPGYAGTHRI